MIKEHSSGSRKLVKASALEVTSRDELLTRYCSICKANLCKCIEYPAIEAAVKGLLSCQAGSQLCLAVLLDGVDEIMRTPPVNTANMLAVCSTRRSRDSFERFGAHALLFDHFIADVGAAPFTPKLQVDKARVLRFAPKILEEICKNSGSPLMDEIDWDQLQEWKQFKTMMSKLPVRYHDERHALWKAFGLLGDRNILGRWRDAIQSKPDILSAWLENHAINVVLFPDASLLVNEMRWMIIVLHKLGVKIVIIGDIRAMDPVEAERLLALSGIHIHEISLSYRPQELLDLLNQSSRVTYPQLSPIESTSGDSKLCSVYGFGDRSELVESIGISLARATGLTASQAFLASDASRKPPRFEFGDIRGKSVLVVAPTLYEAARMSQQLANFVCETPKIVGQRALWRAKVEQLMLILDPLEEFVSSSAESNRHVLGAGSFEIIIKGLWRQASSRRALPSPVLSVLHRIPRGPGFSYGLTHARQVFDEVSADLIEGLELARESLDEEDRRLCDRVRQVLAMYREIIGSGESRGQVERLLEIADEAIDLRLPRGQQQDDGVQRWYPTAEHLRSLNGSRAEILLYLHQKLVMRPHAPTLERHPDRASVYVTHVQRMGVDRADHVILARTLGDHMPKERSGISASDHYERECTMMYRAISAARESCQMFLVGERPILPKLL